MKIKKKEKLKKNLKRGKSNKERVRKEENKAHFTSFTSVFYWSSERQNGCQWACIYINTLLYAFFTR